MARGLELVELARHVGCTRDNLAAYEWGTQCPRLHVLMRLADALGTTVRDLTPRRAELPEGFLPGPS